ncbi:MAG: DUF1343 domain-containing protein, partial [bacterium]|nr:DUF1343 domain-containing protein [bacterium]
VGYTLPFKIIGAPWIDGEKLSLALNDKNLPGVIFHPFHYKPYYGTFKDQLCTGVRIVVKDTKVYKPFSTAIAIMEVLLKMYPEKFDFSRKDIKDRISTFDRVCGTDMIRKKLVSGENFQSIENWYEPQLRDFFKKREKYLLYQ